MIVNVSRETVDDFPSLISQFLTRGNTMTEPIMMSAIPTRIGATSDQVRYWVQLLGHRPRREGRVSFVTDDVVDQLESMATLIRDGIQPKDAAARIRGGGETIVHPSPVSTIPATLPPNVVDRLDSMERAITLLVDEVSRLKAENLKLRQDRRQPTEFERFYSSFFQPLPKILETCKQRYEFQPLMLPDLSSTVIEDHLASS